MPTERVRLAIINRGVTVWYQRESEQRVDGRYQAVPYFVENPREALIMREPEALILADRLRSLHPWLEDVSRNGARIDIPWNNGIPAAKDKREPVRVCLDEPVTPQSKWYAVYPANTVNGPKWFVRCNPPGLQPHTLFDDSPILCIERAVALRMLDWAERAPAPEPKPVVQPIQQAPSARRRPGDM